jgi:integrase
MTYLHTSVRGAELRKNDSQLQAAHNHGWKSKTRGGEDREVPLNDETLEILLQWHARFPDAHSHHYVFPFESYGFDGQEDRLHGAVAVGNSDATQAMGSMESAWTTCRKKAGIWGCLHDLRHSFISDLGGRRGGA